jgi:hypothetical protein
MVLGGYRMTTFINFIAGPCAGKSTAAATMFAEAKRRGYAAEMIPEFAKVAVLEGVPITLGRQLQFLGNQIQREEALAGVVDFVFSDGPASVVAYYTRHGAEGLVADHYAALQRAGHRIINYFVPRRFAFDPKGRIHDEAESRMIDETLRLMWACDPLPEDPWPF